MGAWFSVDAELSVDLGPAAVSDDVRATVDYGVVAARIVEMCTKQRVNLLERLAVIAAHAGMVLAKRSLLPVNAARAVALAVTISLVLVLVGIPGIVRGG